MTSGLLDTTFRSLKQISKELETVAHLAVEENEHVILDMNTETLMQGRDSLGEKIRPQYYNDLYANIKNRMNSRPGLGTPDLFLEGDFHGGFFLKPAKMGWEIDSNDEKRDKLVTKYTDSIFGNTEKDEKEINKEYILPELIEYCMDNIKL